MNKSLVQLTYFSKTWNPDVGYPIRHYYIYKKKMVSLSTYNSNATGSLPSPEIYFFLSLKFCESNWFCIVGLLWPQIVNNFNDTWKNKKECECNVHLEKKITNFVFNSL